jgi:PPOX class probable F420-dependent enzyme
VGNPDGSMSADEIEALLQERHIAVISTLNRNGSPQSTPVWYMPEADVLWVIADPDSVKVRNIRRDPRVAITIAADSPPHRYVTFRGQARLLENGVEDRPAKMARRYLGITGGARYMAYIEPHPPFVVIELSRGRSTHWADPKSYEYEE